MSDESDDIHCDLMERWDRLIRPHLVDDGGGGPWRYSGPDAHAEGFTAGVRRLEQIAEAGDLSAAEQLAELVALWGPHHDAALAYKWYHVSLSQQGYTVGFNDQNGTPPDYGGPVGDFRNESMVSGLVSELGFDRARALDAIAADWLRCNGLTSSEE